MAILNNQRVAIITLIDLYTPIYICCIIATVIHSTYIMYDLKNRCMYDNLILGYCGIHKFGLYSFIVCVKRR